MTRHTLYLLRLGNNEDDLEDFNKDEQDDYDDEDFNIDDEDEWPDIDTFDDTKEEE